MTKLSGTKPRPWVKLWREERGLFALLPLFARALDRELHVICDEHGIIEVGSRPHADAVAFALGADRSDRRLLRKFLPELEAAGRLRLEPGRIVLLAWHEEQTRRDDDTTEHGARNDRTTTATPPDRDAATTGHRCGNEGKANHAETRGPVSTEEEKKREDREREEIDRAAAEGGVANVGSTAERAPAAPPTPVERVAELRSKEERRLGGIESGPIAETERQLKVAVDLLEEGYSKRYAAARGGEVWPVDHDARMASRRAVQSCARWALSRGLEHLEERAKKLLDGMFADARLTEASWPWAWVARDPARYAVPPAPPVRAGGKRSDFIEPVTDYSDVPTGPIGMAAKGAG